MKKEELKNTEIKKESTEVINVNLNNKGTTIVSEVTNGLLKRIHDDLKESAKRFVRIGVSLYNFREDHLYRELGYKKFEDFVKAEFGLSKATAYTFINVAIKYTVVSPEGVPSLVLKKEFQKFSSSQLVEMLALDDATMSKVKPTDTIRKIRDLKKSVQTSEHSDPDSTSGTAAKFKSKPKLNEKDSKVPVNRLFVGTAYSFDEIKIHKAIIDKYCDEKRKKEGKSYRVEINIIWDDLTDGETEPTAPESTAPAPGFMNQPEEVTA